MKAGSMDDAELVDAVRGGEQAAFGALVERHGARIHALCFRISGRACDAEELAHDSFVEAYLKLAQLREPARFSAWLRQIALNVCRMWLRHRPREIEFDEARGMEPLPLDEADSEDLARLSLGLGRLGPPHRVVLVLHYLEGLSYEEIATFLETPIGTVMSRLHRARHALRSQLQSAQSDEELPEMTIEQLKLDVEREISVLLDAFGKTKGPAERLSVILRRAPERFARLIQDVERDNLGRLAALLPRLGALSIDVTLALSLGDDPVASVRARAVLKDMIARCQCNVRGGFGDMPAREAYLLVDRLWAREVAPRASAELLLELLEVAPAGPVATLLLQSLLCLREQARTLLVSRYEAAVTPQQLQAESHVLYGLCRFGDAFCELLERELGRPASDRDRIVLAAVEALALCLKLPARSGDAGLEDLRVADKFAPLCRDQLAAGRLQRLVSLVALRSDDPRSEVQEPALRALASFGAREHIARVLAQLDSPRVSTRCIALHALAELLHRSRDDDPAIGALDAHEAIEAITRAAEAGPLAQRCAALSAIARLKLGAALPLLQRMLTSEDASIREASIVALGELGSHEADATLHELMQSSDVAAAKIAANVLFSRAPSGPQWTGSPATQSRLQKLRSGKTPFCRDSLGATVRFATRELRPYQESELTGAIAQVCTDYSAARRHLIEQELMTRNEGVYEFTPLGEAVWRVERFIAERRLRA
jgi:RNA polymerase sigma-70 factor, ECF subfamily